MVVGQKYTKKLDMEKITFDDSFMMVPICPKCGASLEMTQYGYDGKDNKGIATHNFSCGFIFDQIIDMDVLRCFSETFTFICKEICE